jgi:hypothetical protein
MKNEKIKSITEQARQQGILKISTCDAPNWNKEEHDAMLILQVNTPDDLSVSYTKNFGVWDWTVIVREPAEHRTVYSIDRSTPEYYFKNQLPINPEQWYREVKELILKQEGCKTIDNSVMLVYIDNDRR